MDKTVANMILKRAVQLIIVLIAVVIVGRAGTELFHAADVTLSMSSPNSTIKPGDTIKIEIKFDSIHDILALRFFVQYPNDKVDYVGFQKNESLGVDDTVEVIKIKEADNIRDVWVGFDNSKKSLTICTLEFKVKDNVPHGDDIVFAYVQRENVPNGSTADFRLIPMSSFYVTGIMFTVVTPTPKPTDTPKPTTPKPTDTPKPTTQKPTDTPKPNTPTPTETPTPVNETETPPVGTGEQTPEPTGSGTETPSVSDKTPSGSKSPEPSMPINKGNGNDNVDVWAYVFWGFVSIVIGMWGGIGIGYLIWGKRGNKSMFRYRGRY